MADKANPTAKSTLFYERGLLAVFPRPDVVSHPGLTLPRGDGTLTIVPGDKYIFRKALETIYKAPVRMNWFSHYGKQAQLKIHSENHRQTTDLRT